MLHTSHFIDFLSFFHFRSILFRNEATSLTTYLVVTFLLSIFSFSVLNVLIIIYTKDILIAFTKFRARLLIVAK